MSDKKNRDPKKGGRGVTKYNKTMNLLVKALARQGMTDEQMAEEIGIGRATFYKWKKRYTSFRDSCEGGKKEPNEIVKESLFARATGFDYYEEKIVDGPKGRQVEKIKKHALPDATSMIFWLKNRDKENWRDRYEHDVKVNNQEKIREELESIIKEVESDG